MKKKPLLKKLLSSQCRILIQNSLWIIVLIFLMACQQQDFATGVPSDVTKAGPAERPLIQTDLDPEGKFKKLYMVPLKQEGYWTVNFSTKNMSYTYHDPKGAWTLFISGCKIPTDCRILPVSCHDLSLKKMEREGNECHTPDMPEDLWADCGLLTLCENDCFRGPFLSYREGFCFYLPLQNLGWFHCEKLKDFCGTFDPVLLPPDIAYALTCSAILDPEVEIVTQKNEKGEIECRLSKWPPYITMDCKKMEEFKKECTPTSYIPEEPIQLPPPE